MNCLFSLHRYNIYTQNMYLPVHYLDGDYTTPYNYATWLISAIIYSCTCLYQPTTLAGVLLPTMED